MAKAKRSIQFVGGGEEETALLRLLLRQGRPRLEAEWRLDEEGGEPDLVVVDPSTLAGDAAITQARQGGRPFVCVVDTGAPDSGDWHLRRPLKLDAVVRVFNALTPSQEPGARVLSHGEDFFTADLDEGSVPELLDLDALASIPTGAARSRDEGGLRWEEEADALFRRDPDADKVDRIVDIRLGEDTSFDRVDARSARSESRLQASEDRVGQGAGGEGARQLRSGERARRDPRVLPLIDFLRHDILGGPCRTTHGGVHPLVLDPKLRVFHADVDLAELELHCLQSFPVESFEQLTMAEIEAVRASQPARPMVKLQWLCALVNGNGRLAEHLDPGGRYWLSRFLELANDYPQQYAIAAKLSQPRKINELAELTNSRIEEVYNLLNAFDAIGYLEWELRDRLRGVEQQAQAGDEAPGSSDETMEPEEPGGN